MKGEMMAGHHGTHNDLHSEQGALRGEHPGRATDSVIKVRDLAWLEFQKPDLTASERFAHAFGFSTLSRTAEELLLRGAEPGGPCVIVRKGPSKYLGAAFKAADASDVVRLAGAVGRTAAQLPENLGGLGVDLVDPSGARVRVVADLYRASRYRPSTSAARSSGSTGRSGHPESPPESSGWATSCSRPPSTWRRSTGT